MTEIETGRTRNLMTARNLIESRINDGWSLIGFSSHHTDNMGAEYTMIFSKLRRELDPGMWAHETGGHGMPR